MNAGKLVLTSTVVAASATLAFVQPAAAPAKDDDATASAALLGLDDTLVLGDTLGLDTTLLDDAVGTVIGTTGELIGVVDQDGTVKDSVGQVIGTVEDVTGLVLDPAGDVIGAVLDPPKDGSIPKDPPVGGGGAGDPGGGGDAPLRGQVLQNDIPPLKLRLSARRVQRVRSLGRGIRVNASCDRGCGVLGRLEIGRAMAKRLGLGNRAAVIGMLADADGGKVTLQLSRRTQRALSRALVSTRTRRAVRTKKYRALRQYRQATSSSERRTYRRRYQHYRRKQRRVIRGSVKMTFAAVGVDRAGRVSSIRYRSLYARR